MTISNLPQDYFCFEIIPVNNTTTQEKDLFLAFHNAACEKAGKNLKPTTLEDLEQSNFVATAYDKKGNVKAQCLLIKGDSTADKIATYPSEAKTECAFIITSLTGKKAIPILLDGIDQFGSDEGISVIFAKARASNTCARGIFPSAGYVARGPKLMGRDNYESFLYSRVLQPNVNICPTMQAGAAVHATI